MASFRKRGSGPRTAKCTWRDNLDPEWSGESLADILQNDMIYPPSIFPRLIEHAWLAWRSGELDDAAVDGELNALADWLNKISKSKARYKILEKLLLTVEIGSTVQRTTV